MFENIPKNWKKDKLKNYIEIIRGVNYKTDDAYDVSTPDTTVLLRANNISSNGTINFDKVIYVSNKNIKNEQIIKKNDILIAMSSGSKDLVGKAAQSDSDLDYSFGAFCSVVRPKIINPKLIGYYFQTDFYRTKISELSTGININNLRKEYIENLDIAIPPSLEEQQEIVDVLDAASEIIRLRTACIESAQSLIPALFQEMFGDMHDKNENLVAIGSVIEETSQVNPQKLFTDQFLYIDISSINNETGIIESPKIINIDNIPSRARKLVKVDDLLVAMTRPYLKGFAMVPENLDNNIASTGFSVLRAQKDKIVPKYLYAYIRSDYFINQIIPKMRGANYPAVTDNDVKSVKIPLPKLDQQELFAAKVQEIEAYIKIQQAELEKAQTMFNSLLHHAFTGKLTENITFEVENE